MSAPTEGLPVLSMTFVGDATPPAAAGIAVYDTAMKQRVCSISARHLRNVVEELVQESLEREHGSDPAVVKVVILIRGDRLVVEVHDKGIPAANDDPVLAIPHELARLGFVAEFKIALHGHSGNVAVCEVDLHCAEDRPAFHDVEEKLEEDVARAEDWAELEIRRMRPEETLLLSRCMYRCYGYTYSNGEVYDPTRMAALVESGLMISVVAVNGAGEIVGHVSATLAAAGSLCAEADKMVVDPRYRGHGLAGKMVMLHRDIVKEVGLRCLWSECVSNHLISQLSELKSGAQETGVFLATIEAESTMVGIDTDEKQQRHSLIAFFRAISGVPKRTIHVPEHYADLTRKIVGKLAIEREIVSTPGSWSPSGPTLIHLTLVPTRNVAFIDVSTIGENFADHLADQLAGLLALRVDAVYLDLPANDPGTATVGQVTEGLEFFFSAVLPELRTDGDVLRLQFLNELTLDISQVKSASPEGRALIAAVESDRQRVYELSRNRRLGK